jgi:hypothetical protein
LTQLDNLALLVDHPVRNRGNLTRETERDRLNPVTIPMEQVARSNLHVSHFHGRPKIENVGIGM